MVHRMTRRLVVCCALLAAVAVPLAAAPASAAGPTTITIEGPGLDGPITVRTAEQPELFAALWSQVGWLSSRPGEATAPKANRKGPKYTVVVFVKDSARQTYDLYPLAVGGPRAFRPAKQPDLRNTTSAWFFGRLDMAGPLRAAGVPLPARPDVATGGIGGGSGRVGEEATYSPVDDVHLVLGQWRQVYLLNAAVLVAITLGLAGFSLLIRRKI
jgi:hypothetical protein